MKDFKRTLANVSLITGVTEKQLKSKCRHKDIIRARMLFVMCIVRGLKKIDYNRIAEFLNLHRSTIYNTIEKGYERLEFDDFFKEQLEDLDLSQDLEYLENITINKLMAENKRMKRQIRELSLKCGRLRSLSNYHAKMNHANRTKAI